jgi:hypothetical protein
MFGSPGKVAFVFQGYDQARLSIRNFLKLQIRRFSVRIHAGTRPSQTGASLPILQFLWRRSKGQLLHWWHSFALLSLFAVSSDLLLRHAEPLQSNKQRTEPSVKKPDASTDAAPFRSVSLLQKLIQWKWGYGEDHIACLQATAVSLLA